MVVHYTSCAMKLLLSGAGLLLGAAKCTAQETGMTHPTKPAFSIWDVKFGTSVAEIDPLLVAEIACGTNGGPPSQPLVSFSEADICIPEPTGLREIYFTYDDEQNYVALAREVEFDFLTRGTSVFAHPVIVSVLVDAEGKARGIRIVTDDRVGSSTRRTAMTLGQYYKGRYSNWEMICDDIPMADGEQPIGDRFVHESCTGQKDGHQLSFETTYLRKKGQRAINPETQEVNSDYFESRVRLEVLEEPYAPAGQ